MKKQTILVKKLDPRAILPIYSSQSAAGADLFALAEAPIEIAPGETVMVRTGLAVEIPEGCCGLIYARSGMATKRGLAPANKVGVIDSDYRGELMIALHNHGASAQSVSPGERVAQLVVAPVLVADFVEAESLSDTVRAAGGFGSTGEK